MIQSSYIAYLGECTVIFFVYVHACVGFSEGAGGRGGVEGAGHCQSDGGSPP